MLRMTVKQTKAIGRSIDGQGIIKIRRIYRDRACKSAIEGLVCVEVGTRRLVVDHNGNGLAWNNEYHFIRNERGR